MRHYQQYYTSNSAWLTKPITDFIAFNDNGTIVDPFGGQGDLLKVLPNHLTEDRRAKGALTQFW